MWYLATWNATTMKKCVMEMQELQNDAADTGAGHCPEGCLGGKEAPRIRGGYGYGSTGK